MWCGPELEMDNRLDVPCDVPTLEAQQRHFSYRTMFVAIVSQNAFCLFFYWVGAEGAEKASCGKTVVRKGVFGESGSSLPP